MLALTSYIEAAMARADYEKLEDGTYGGEIPGLDGVIAFGPTLRQCEEELRSTLADWILLGFHLEHTLPVIAGIDLVLDGYLSKFQTFATKGYLSGCTIRSKSRSTSNSGQ